MSWDNFKETPFFDIWYGQRNIREGERTKRTQILAFTRQEGFLNYSQQKRRCYKANMGWCEQSYKWFGKTKRKLSCSLITWQHSLRFPLFSGVSTKIKCFVARGQPHMWPLNAGSRRHSATYRTVPICLDKLSINGLPYVLSSCMAPKALGTFLWLALYISYPTFRFLRN